MGWVKRSLLHSFYIIIERNKCYVYNMSIRYIYIHTCIYVYTCVCVYTHIYMYIYGGGERESVNVCVTNQFITPFR